MTPDKLLIVAPPTVEIHPSEALRGRVRIQRLYRATAAFGAAGALRPDAVLVSLALPDDRAPRLCQRLRALLGEATLILACGPIPSAKLADLPPRAALRRTWGADDLLPSPTPAALDAALLGPPAVGASVGVLGQVWRWATRAAS